MRLSRADDPTCRVWPRRAGEPGSGETNAEGRAWELKSSRCGTFRGIVAGGGGCGVLEAFYLGLLLKQVAESTYLGTARMFCLGHKV